MNEKSKNFLSDKISILSDKTINVASHIKTTAKAILQSYNEKENSGAKIEKTVDLNKVNLSTIKENYQQVYNVGASTLNETKSSMLSESLIQAIKIIARAYRGEEINKDVVKNAIGEIFAHMKSGAFKGLCKSILKIIMKKNAAILVFSVSAEIIPMILEYMDDKMSMKELIEKAGIKALITTIVVVLTMLFPPISIAMFGYSIFKTILEEFIA